MPSAHTPLMHTLWLRLQRHAHVSALRIIAPLGLCLCLSLLMTYPLVTQLDDTIPGWEGDNVFFVWELWWMKHALVDLQVTPFVSQQVYYPQGYELARDELTPANTVLGLPFTLSVGAVTTYNLLVLLSFVLSGYGAYLWTLRLTHRRSAALLGGIAFAFLPYRFAHLAGHLNLMATQWMSFALLAIDQWLARPAMNRAVVVSIFVALIMLAAWYYAMFAVLLVPLYILARWLASGRPLSRALLVQMVVMLLLVAVLVVPFAWPAGQVASNENFNRQLIAKEFWSLNPYDYLIPNRLSPWWGDWVAETFPFQSKAWVDRGVTLSLVVVALALIGLWRGARRRLPIVLVLLCAFIISLGPTLHWDNQQIRFPLSPHAHALLEQWGVSDALTDALGRAESAIVMTDSSAAIPLPTLAIHLWMPFARGMRVIDRIAVWVALMMVALAALGFARLQNRMARARWPHAWRHLAWAAVVLIILLESYSSLGGASLPAASTRLVPRRVDTWLTQRTSGVVLEFPWWRRRLDYYSTVHARPVIFGVQGAAFPPAIHRERVELLSHFPSPESISALKRWHVSYLLLTPRDIPDWDRMRARLDAYPELQLELVIDDVWVYSLDY